MLRKVTERDYDDRNRDQDHGSSYWCHPPVKRSLIMTTKAQTELKRVQNVPQVVLDMAECLVETFHPERIYLFGSYARGDMTPDSDYDLMMIVSESPLPQYERSQQAHRVLFDFHQAKDVLVWTRDEFDRRVHLVASLPATILREGVLLYDHRSTKSQ